MTTLPYDERAVPALAESLAHSWTLDAVLDDVTVGLDVVDATVVFDERWSPHVQANLTVRVPEDPAVLDMLDPRRGGRLDLYAGYDYTPDYTGSTDLHRLANLGITRRSVRRPQNDLVLSAMSDEVLAQETLWHSGLVGPGFIYNAPQAINQLLQAALGIQAEISTAAAGTGGNDDGSAWVADDYLPPEQVGYVSFWELIESIADTWGLWVYDAAVPNEGMFHGWNIQRRPTQGMGTVAHLATGPGGLITSSESSISREDGWANTVHLSHSWTTSTGSSLTRNARRFVTSGPFSVDEVGYHGVVVRRDTPITYPNLRRAAANLARRTVTRGRSYRLTAPAMYWLRPGYSATVQLPTGGQERHLVSSVSFNLRRGEMVVTTRLPESVTIGGTE